MTQALAFLLIDLAASAYVIGRDTYFSVTSWPRAHQVKRARKQFTPKNTDSSRKLAKELSAQGKYLRASDLRVLAAIAGTHGLNPCADSSSIADVSGVLLQLTEHSLNRLLASGYAIGHEHNIRITTAGQEAVDQVRDRLPAPNSRKSDDFYLDRIQSEMSQTVLFAVGALHNSRTPVNRATIARSCGYARLEVQSELRHLARSGAVTVESDGLVVLTPKGHRYVARLEETNFQPRPAMTTFLR